MIKGRLIILLMFFCTTAATTKAQSLSGTVKDSTGNSLLPGVNVVIDGIKKGTATNKNGFFSFRDIPEGIYNVRFSFIGMQTKTKRIKIKAGKKNILNVYMIDNATKLAGISITTKRERKEIKEVKRQGIPVSVIDGKELSARGTTLQEVLNHQTGLKLRQTGGSGTKTQINIRGLEGNRVQIYMDGYALNTPDGSFSVDDVPLQFIDRIEVYKGIVPPEFGGDGLGSAINIVTIDPEYGYYDASMGIESYGVYNPGFCINHYFNKIKTAVTFFLGGKYAKNNYTMDSPYIQGLKIKRNHDKLKMKEFGLTFKFRNKYFNKSEIEIVGYKSKKETQGIKTNIKYTHAEVWTLGANPKLEKKGFLLPDLDLKFSGMVTYSHTCLNDTSSYLFDFYGNKTVNTYGGESGYVPNLSDDGLWDYRSDLNLKYHLIRDKMDININNSSRYVVRTERDTAADTFLGTNYSGLKSHILNVISSVAVQNKWFGGRLSSVITGRHYLINIGGTNVNLAYPGDAHPTHPDNTGNYLGYSLALRYDLTESLLIKLAAEHNYRLPKYEEILGDRITTIANTELKPENAYNLNLGILYDKYYNSDSRIQIESNIYLDKIQNMMFLTSILCYSKYENIGKALLYGADAEIKYDINKNWYASVNGTWQKSINYSKYVPGTNTVSTLYKKQIPHIPVLFFNWTADYRKNNLFGGKGQYARIYYEGGYTDKYYYGYQLTNNKSYKIPTVCSHTLGFEYGLKNRTILFGAECHNIFNAKEITNFNYPLPGRIFRAKIRFTSIKW